MHLHFDCKDEEYWPKQGLVFVTCFKELQSFTLAVMPDSFPYTLLGLIILRLWDLNFVPNTNQVRTVSETTHLTQQILPFLCSGCLLLSAALN